MQFKHKAIVMKSMRSNAKGAKELVSNLNKKCDDASRAATVSEADIPYYECAMLAEFADDAFYRVVIRSADGVATIVKAMKAFPEHACLQEVCCNSLGRLFVRNGSDLQDDRNMETMLQILATMRMHSGSVAVQSAACVALQAVSSVVLMPQSQPRPQMLINVADALTKALDMVVAPRSKERAEHLLIVQQLQGSIYHRVKLLSS
ncbi:hypothetical protein MHU86_13020 [Fragilaria crotonensis]|nr:hypothetical protein MHU86_13020 [Fragilaria crotonensis]